MIDLLIRGATVLDGTGAAGRIADVAVRAGRVVAVGNRIGNRADHTLDAGGLVVAPGFIDMHSHADYTLPANPLALNSIAQGVTTEVIGNCGFSPAPLSIDPSRATETRLAGRGFGPSLDWNWQSFGDYLAHLDAAQPFVNCIALVGHGTLRLSVMGSDDRMATPFELAAMRAATAEALAAGAWGLSTGLVYPPGSFASTDEVAAIGEAVRAVDGLYCTHIRNENEGLDAALGEAVEIGRRLGVRVHVSHLKAAGRENAGRASEALGLLAEARESGMVVTQDVYPYNAASTLMSQLVPPWVHAGGADMLIERLRTPGIRARIAADIESGLPGWPNYIGSSGGWAQIVISAVVEPSLRRFEGLTLDEAARLASSDPLEVMLDVLIADRASTTIIIPVTDAADVRVILADPSSAIGSDGLGVISPSARVHPRAYGTFARVLNWASRGSAPFDLPTAVHRMTGLPARILGLTDRGRVAPGTAADLVVFDPATVADRATYKEPTRLPIGIEAVFVDGQPAIERGEPTAIRAGRVLIPQRGRRGR